MAVEWYQSMAGKTVRLFTLSVLLMAGGLRASAETAVPTENVTVTSHAVRSMNSPRPSPRRQWSRER
jgi:hypothetical protein